MSMQRGTFRFDAQPVLTCGRAAYREAGVVMEQGGDSVWTDAGPAAPVRSASGLVATWDGRLDNREDLLLRLGVDCRREWNDPDIALAVFERWGIVGLNFLIGDWSLAVWDSTHRTLHLARDYMGVRPLYYCADTWGVAWSSDLGELVERTGRRDALNETFAAHCMSQRSIPGFTPYEGIYALTTGACVVFREDGTATTTRFWTLQAGEVRYADSGQYEEHLRTLWCEAVGARLRTEGTVWAELSGGLDSSSVVCMADWLIGRHRVPARGIRLVSHATLQSPEGDERRFIAEVEQRVGVRSEIVGVEDNQGHVDPNLAWISPDVLHGVGLESVRRIRDGGGRVVLSGRLGDAVMGGQPDNSASVFDDFSHGAILTGLGKMRAWSRATRKPFLEVALGLSAQDEQIRPDTGLDLLTPRLRAKIVPRASEISLKGIRGSKRALAWMILGYARGQRLDFPLQLRDVVYTYPFSHRPLLEFVLAIPGEELSAPGLTRSLMRRAFAGLVPDRILRRQSKGYYPPATFRAARRAIASMLQINELEVVQRGWIDADRLRAAIRTLTAGSGGTGGDIQRVLRLENWLGARQVCSPMPQRKEVNSDAVLNA